MKHKGLVVCLAHSLYGLAVEFRVSEKGRQKVIKEKRKNVHAFVVADKYMLHTYPVMDIRDIDNSKKISYNPFTDAQFMCDNRRIYSAEEVFFQNGYCVFVK